jgi:hypothetical protein
MYGDDKLSTEVDDKEFASSSYIKYTPVSNFGQEIREVGMANCALPKNEDFVDSCTYDGTA